MSAMAMRAVAIIGLVFMGAAPAHHLLGQTLVPSGPETGSFPTLAARLGPL